MFCSKCGKELKESENFCSNCGAKLDLRNFNETNANLIANEEHKKLQKSELSRNDLIVYLDKIKLLEIRKYAFINARNKLNNKIRKEINGNLSYEKRTLKEYEYLTYPILDILWDALIITGKAFLVLIIPIPIILFTIDEIIHGTFVGHIVDSYYNYFPILYPYILIIIFCIFCVKEIGKNIKIKKKKKKEIIKIEELNNNAKKNAEINREKENLAIKQKNEEIKVKNEEINVELQKTEELLKKLYSLNFIHKKYHNNFIAITSFLEYFETGRCENLQGFTGAYNIYENEVRQDIIISKLDDVLDSLEKIRQNQFTLYCAIKEGNQMTSELIASNNKLSENTKMIAKNEKIIAENTEIIKFLELYN